MGVGNRLTECSRPRGFRRQRSPIDSVCDPTGEVWSTPGLYVMDGAAFPTASGVNPMVTIEALSHMNARGLAAKLGAVA